MSRFLVTLALALAGGGIFTVIHAPLPWLLGPMAFAFLGARVLKKYKMKPLWPGYLRNSAMIAIGYSMGLSITAKTLAEIGKQLPTMVLMTVLLMLFCLLIGWTVSKLSGQPLPTALMGSIPGGLSQMIILAEDTPGIDLTIVTFMQVSRLMMIIFCVPMLIFSPLFGGTHSAVAAAASAPWSGLLPDVLPYVAICIAAAFLAAKIRFPAAFLLGPMIATAAVHLAGLSAPALPGACLQAAQLLMGTYVGLLLHPETLTNKARTISLAILSGLVLIAGSLGLSALLTRLHDVTPATAFLSMAPGGMDQMGIMAKEIHADVAIITCYQLFRTWFILFAVTPLLRLLLKRLKPKPSPDGEAAGSAEAG